MKINEAPMHTSLKVLSFSDSDSRDLNDIESRLMHLGFTDGQTIVVKKKAPLFQEPILVEVRGRSVALSLSEAMLVEVEVKK